MHSTGMRHTIKMVLLESSCKKTGVQCFKVSGARVFLVANNIKNLDRKKSTQRKSES